MITLDEVIKAVHHCGLLSGFDDSYEYDGGCPYEDCSKCEQKRMLGKDIIHYLKVYKDDKDDLTALRAYWAEQQGNPALTWDELKQMEGKPVWVEAESISVGICPYWKDWYIIKSFSNDEFMYCNDGFEWAKETQGRLWQAYRKERK